SPFGMRTSSTMSCVALSGAGVSSVTTTMDTRLAVAPTMPKRTSSMPHHGTMPPHLTAYRYQVPAPRPTSMPAIAPALLARFHQTPSTSGKKHPRNGEVQRQGPAPQDVGEPQAGDERAYRADHDQQHPSHDQPALHVGLRVADSVVQMMRQVVGDRQQQTVC